LSPVSRTEEQQLTVAHCVIIAQTLMAFYYPAAAAAAEMTTQSIKSKCLRVSSSDGHGRAYSKKVAIKKRESCFFLF